MTKIKDLPQSNSSNRSDFLTIVQNGVTKKITKEDLVKDLKASIQSISSQVSGISTKVNRDVLNKNDLNFQTPVMGKDPVNSGHLSTKRYVDNKLHNTIKNDGSTKINSALSYRVSPMHYNPTDLVDRNFIDGELKNVLKKITKVKGDEGYPAAKAGQTFIVQERQEVFAIDGPEVQEGDIIMCIEDSQGGRHESVGHQFAIVNTNVVLASEATAGILKVASFEDTQNLISDTTAITPRAYKNALETSSEYNRTIVVTPTHLLTESERGIVGVDCRRNPVELTLPSIGRMTNPKIVKFLIKDEYGNAVRNNITLKTSGGNTIQGSRTYLINSNNASVKLYCDGESTWYLESNVSSGSESSAGVKTFVTSDINSGERAATTGAYESVMSIDVDLREYPIGSGFKVVAHCFAAANGNTKTVAIGVDGAQVLPSSLTTTTAPNGVFIHHEVTVLHSDTPKSIGFGFVIVGADLDAVSAGASNNLELDWDQKIAVSLDVNNATAATDVSVYALQVIPLK